MSKVQRMIPILAAVFLSCFMSVTSFAAGELPDLNRTGSITVTVRDTESKKPVAGGSLKLYQVALVNENDGDYSFAYTDAFSGCRFKLDDIESEDLAEDLAGYAADKKLKGTKKTVNADGKVKFTGLELGLYLVTQDQTAENYSELNPFLVSVPLREDENLVYDVNASPKAGTVTKESTPPANDPGTGNHKHKHSSSSSDTAPTAAAAVPQLATVLPQTGQLWWPVPLLAVAGILLVAAGWMKRKYEDD